MLFGFQDLLGLFKNALLEPLDLLLFWALSYVLFQSFHDGQMRLYF